MAAGAPTTSRASATIPSQTSRGRSRPTRRSLAQSRARNESLLRICQGRATARPTRASRSTREAKVPSSAARFQITGVAWRSPATVAGGSTWASSIHRNPRLRRSARALFCERTSAATRATTEGCYAIGQMDRKGHWKRKLRKFSGGDCNLPRASGRRQADPCFLVQPHRDAEH